MHTIHTYLIDLTLLNVVLLGIIKHKVHVIAQHIQGLVTTKLKQQKLGKIVKTCVF